MASREGVLGLSRSWWVGRRREILATKCTGVSSRQSHFIRQRRMPALASEIWRRIGDTMHLDRRRCHHLRRMHVLGDDINAPRQTSKPQAWPSVVYGQRFSKDRTDECTGATCSRRRDWRATYSSSGLDALATHSTTDPKPGRWSSVVHGRRILKGSAV